MSRLVSAAIAAAALLLPGCTSFSGTPAPVITVAQAQALVADKLPDRVIANMATMSPDQRTIERNRVVASYLMAADAKYDQFRGDLAGNVKGGNVAFDVLTLGLTGLASRWTSAAKDLAAGATVVGGTRASLNRELYFEQTLPTLLSLMDSKRLSVRTDILNGLAKPESEYTIEEAYSDIWRYQSAASIDGAIQQAAAGAAVDAQQAEYDYSKAVKLCRVPADVGGSRRSIMLAIDSLKRQASTADGQTAEANRTKIRDVAAAAGIADAALATDVPSTQAQVSQIGAYLRGLCSAEDVEAFKAKVQQAGVTVQ
jgi:hypothetical protein